MEATETTHQAHDHHAPQQIVPQRTGDYLEVMSKAIFQTGISWKVVENKWPGIHDAFRGFDHRLVASLTEAELADLSADPRVIRNRRKIEATIHNAATMLELEREYGTFKKYLESQGDFESLLRDMRKRFKFVGAFGAYYFLWVVQQPVPPHDEFRAKLKVS